jgi:hypothetical protein
MKAISVCVMEDSGKIKMRKDVAASPETLLTVIKPYLPHCLVGLYVQPDAECSFSMLPRREEYLLSQS